MHDTVRRREGDYSAQETAHLLFTLSLLAMQLQLVTEQRPIDHNRQLIRLCCQSFYHTATGYNIAAAPQLPAICLYIPNAPHTPWSSQLPIHSGHEKDT